MNEALDGKRPEMIFGPHGSLAPWRCKSSQPQTLFILTLTLKASNLHQQLLLKEPSYDVHESTDV